MDAVSEFVETVFKDKVSLHEVQVESFVTSHIQLQVLLCEFLVWIQDSWQLQICMIKTPPAVKSLCPNTRLLGGPRQRQARGPFNYTLSIYIHPFQLTETGSEQSLHWRAAAVNYSWSLQTEKNTHCTLELVELLKVTLIIFISNMHSPLAPYTSFISAIIVAFSLIILQKVDSLT